MMPCSDLDLLRRLVSNELSGAEEQNISQHVDGCSVCQKSIEELLERESHARGGQATILYPGPEMVFQTPAPLPEGDAAATVHFQQAVSFVARLRQGLKRSLWSESSQSPGSSGDECSRMMPIVPGYEILGELGRGGMGVVYKARQVILDRPVALKMILGGLHASEEHRARLRSEAELAARLTHPNLVQVYEVGEAGGLPFLAMEFVEGGTLSRRLAAGPLQPREIASLVATLAEAVQAAHCRNVIHRDLKPANILLTPAGVPKIADFGLARGLDCEGRRTLSGQILGTPSFMAPEQAAGRSGDVGPAADIYALGAILYAILTGQPPFAGNSPLDTLMQVCHQEATPPSRFQG